MTKQLDAGKWVKLATLKDIAANAYEKQNKPALFKTWAMGGKSLGADGFRMHYVESVLPEAETPWEGLFDYTSLIPSNRKQSVTVSTWALAQALRACKPFSRDANNITRWSVNGELEVSAISAEYGDVSVSIRDGDVWSVKNWRKVKQVPIVYQHIGENIEFALSVKYALDALSGMGDVTTIYYQSATKPFHFVGEHRGAVVMPLHVS